MAVAFVSASGAANLLFSGVLPLNKFTETCHCVTALYAASCLSCYSCRPLSTFNISKMAKGQAKGQCTSCTLCAQLLGNY